MGRMKAQGALMFNAITEARVSLQQQQLMTLFAPFLRIKHVDAE